MAARATAAGTSVEAGTAAPVGLLAIVATSEAFHEWPHTCWEVMIPRQGLLLLQLELADPEQH